MIQVLKSYDKSFAEGMLARTSFYLENDPMFKTLKPIENEEIIRNNIISEICSNLNIPSITHNKQAVLDYLDNELDKSTKLDEKTEKEILTRLSIKGELPTDLYTVKINDNTLNKEFNEIDEISTNYITETIKKPDMTYDFGTNYCASIFAKFYKEKYEYNSFFLLVVGKREGLNFNVNQVWYLYNDILLEKNFNNALELLQYFVEKFGVEVDLHGSTSKFFIDVIAKSENEFQVKVENKKLKKAKTGDYGFVACHFLGPTPAGDSNFRIFFAIDIEKYKEYLKTHSHRKRH